MNFVQEWSDAKPLPSDAAPIAVWHAAATSEKLIDVDWPRIAALGCTVVTLDAREFGPTLRLEDRLHRLRVELLVLRFEAESAGFRLAIQMPCRELPLSAVGLRDFLDALTTPWVGAALDLTGLPDLPERCDWIETLGRRLLVVRGPRDAFDEPTVAALRKARFAGPAVLIEHASAG